MTEFKKDELLNLAKCLARTLTCSGNLAKTSSLKADDRLKQQQAIIKANNLTPITETSIGLGDRPQAQYTVYLAHVIARLFDCMGLYKLIEPGEEIGNHRFVTFIGKGNNPDAASYLFYEVWQRLKNERASFAKLLPGRNDKARKKQKGDEFALSQVNRLRNQIEMFIMNNEMTTKAIQAHLLEKYGFHSEPRFQPIEDTYDNGEIPKKRAQKRRSA
jgi:hypothetical protein